MESPNTNTYVFDPESTVELARLIDQDRFLTQAMGGPLVGLPDLHREAKVLDVACGPGGWVLDVAFARPDIEIAGVDVSQRMITYAAMRARSQGRLNVSFGVMDITRPLDFSDATFDLVNARLLIAALKREAWDPFLDECTRILRPGGVLRLIETDDGGTSDSETFEWFNSLGIKALWRRGYGFSPNGRTFGMGPALLRKLKKRGYQTTLRSFTGDYSHDSPAWADFYHNLSTMARQSRAMLLEMLLEEGHFTAEELAREIDQRYTRLAEEMEDVSFSATWQYIVLDGTLNR